MAEWWSLFLVYYIFFEKSKICGDLRCAAEMSTIKMSIKTNFGTSSKTVT